MVKQRNLYCRISSSIANFKEKLLKRFDLLEWHWLKTMFLPTIFFGMYHPGDYLRLLWHRGKRKIFWCGGDIINLKNSSWRHLIWRLTAEHLCENEVEQRALKELRIEAQIQPMFFGDITQFPISYKHSNSPHAYISVHPGREGEYGLWAIEPIAKELRSITFHIFGISGQNRDNVIYHGQVSEEEFNERIKKYQCAVRLNDFDGFADITAKSILLGQYPITKIYYPNINQVKNTEDLINFLESLKTKTEPNYLARSYWLNKLSKEI